MKQPQVSQKICFYKANIKIGVRHFFTSSSLNHTLPPPQLRSPKELEILVHHVSCVLPTTKKLSLWNFSFFSETSEFITLQGNIFWYNRKHLSLVFNVSFQSSQLLFSFQVQVYRLRIYTKMFVHNVSFSTKVCLVNVWCTILKWTKLFHPYPHFVTQCDKMHDPVLLWRCDFHTFEFR